MNIDLYVAADVLENMSFDVSETRGFLPPDDPLTILEDYAEWETIATQLSALINARKLREAVAALPVISTQRLQTRAQWERAMLVLSCLGHGYLREAADDCREIPAQIAVPWCEVAAELGRPPVLSHGSIVLRNWRRIDPEGPIALGNLATLLQFHGGLDEAWFYLVTVEIEAIGARGVFHLIEAVLDADRGAFENVTSHLAIATEVMDEMSACLLRIHERCDPYIFYRRVRPFLSSLEAVAYRGVTPEVQSHHGGSAAQSSLLQTYDRALGIYHPSEPSRGYMADMLRYMPAPHRDFVDWMGRKPLRAHCDRVPPVGAAWSACAAAVARFRQHHLEIVARYVIAQATDEGGERGTGGTNPMVFLKQMKRDTSG
jgi:indoleamine 2,3-dioxygenase